MRGVQAAREKMAEKARHISLSLHCETAEIMTAYTKLVEADGGLTGLAAYSASRPPHSEGLAVTIASFLADETGLPNVNLLHLSSRKALQAAMRMAHTFEHVDFRREVTVGHLLADVDTAHGLGGKVNPPLRPREDVEALWEYVLDGSVDWVVSDHACCKDEQKFGDPRDDIFAAKSGFGGAEYLLPGLVGEGHAAWPVVPADRAADLVEPGPAVRPAEQGHHRRRVRRRLLPGRPEPVLDSARRGLRVHPGVHTVRGLRGRRHRDRHLGPRPPGPC